MYYYWLNKVKNILFSIDIHYIYYIYDKVNHNLLFIMVCEHGKQKHQCKECGGSSICEHGRMKTTCKECGGSSICEHGRRKTTCK